MSEHRKVRCPTVTSRTKVADEPQPVETTLWEMATTIEGLYHDLVATMAKPEQHTHFMGGLGYIVNDLRRVVDTIDDGHGQHEQ